MIHSKMKTKKVKIISLVFTLVVLLLGAVSVFAMDSNNKNTNDSYSILNEDVATIIPQRDEKLSQFKNGINDRMNDEIYNKINNTSD